MITTIAPLSGWMLDCVVELDAYHLGFAASYLRSSNERRQVTAAYLSQKPMPEAGRPELAEFLLKAGHGAILRSAYGVVPQGLRGALARAGGQPHDHKFYTVLHRLLMSPRHNRVTPTISQMAVIDLPRVRIVNLLPPEACAPQVVEALGDVETAKDAARVIELLAQNGVDRAALGRAITSVSDRQQLSRLWERWAGRCRLPASPIQATQEYRPVETADDLRRLARRYRNCAARYVPDALDHQSSFGEFLFDGRPVVVVHLRRRPDGWEIDGLFLRDNARPSPEQRERVRDFLHGAGVIRREPTKQPSGPWSSLRRLTSRMVWDLDDD